MSQINRKINLSFEGDIHVHVYSLLRAWTILLIVSIFHNLVWNGHRINQSNTDPFQGHPSGDDPGPEPSSIEWLLLPWIISLIVSEVGQLWAGGASDYVKDRWNVMDFFMNSLYLATISTKFCAYYIHKDIPRESRLSRVEWDPLHPTLISEALFAVANIFSFMRLSMFYQSLLTTR